MATSWTLIPKITGSIPVSRSFFFKVMILIEFTIYVLLLITDTTILYLLQLLNPYYGANSSSYSLRVLDVLNELQDVNPDNMSAQEYFSFVTDKMKVVHYYAWNIILNG